MQSESSTGFEHRMTTNSEDKEIPSMLDIATKANKILLRLRKHAKTCDCCREVLNEET